MATTAELAASIGSLIATQEKAFAIVNGPATGVGSTVTVASGVIPTFAKKLAELTSPINLTPETLTLPDFGSTTPPLGALGLKNGLPAYGTGSDVGGKLIGASRRLTGISKINLAGFPKSGKAVRIVPIPFYAGELAIGATIKITGKVEYQSLSINTLSRFFAGFAWDASSLGLKDAGKGWQYANLHPTPGTGANIQHALLSPMISTLVFDNGLGKVIMPMGDVAYIPSLMHVYNTGNDPYTSNPNGGVMNTDLYTEDTPVEAAANLWVMLQFVGSGSGNWLTAEGIVTWDLNVEVIAP